MGNEQVQPELRSAHCQPDGGRGEQRHGGGHCGERGQVKKPRAILCHLRKRTRLLTEEEKAHNRTLAAKEHNKRWTFRTANGNGHVRTKPKKLSNANGQKTYGRELHVYKNAVFEPDWDLIDAIEELGVVPKYWSKRNGRHKRLSVSRKQPDAEAR